MRGLYNLPAKRIVDVGESFHHRPRVFLSGGGGLGARGGGGGGFSPARLIDGTKQRLQLSFGSCGGRGGGGGGDDPFPSVKPRFRRRVAISPAGPLPLLLLLLLPLATALALDLALALVANSDAQRAHEEVVVRERRGPGVLLTVA